MSFVPSDTFKRNLKDYGTTAPARLVFRHFPSTDADNGVENSSSRTQFIKRLVEFADKSKIIINLACYPPYHSKYNPIERVWGIYENHICGDIMDTVETTLKFAESMAYNGKKPSVRLIKQVYETGVKVTKKAMKKFNKYVDRMPLLEKWSLKITPGYFG